jgi:hypothetical protein
MLLPAVIRPAYLRVNQHLGSNSRFIYYQTLADFFISASSLMTVRVCLLSIHKKSQRYITTDG